MYPFAGCISAGDGAGWRAIAGRTVSHRGAEANVWRRNADGTGSAKTPAGSATTPAHGAGAAKRRGSEHPGSAKTPAGSATTPAYGTGAAKRRGSERPGSAKTPAGSATTPAHGAGAAKRQGSEGLRRMCAGRRRPFRRTARIFPTGHSMQ